MKTFRMITLVLFAAAIIVPLAFFNFTPDSVSVIDNRKLTENPFQTAGDLTTNIENYVSDRIGFRDEMITCYTVMNDKLFGKMVHPSYKYGKDGYVFGAGVSTSTAFSDFHVAFADMVAEVQRYCEERDVPFLFVFNPAKPAIYQDKLADGINYNREWVDLFLAELDKRDINYLDNTQTMLALREDGLDGFNRKYDANHWNYLGAYHGTHAILERLHEQCDTVHINSMDEFVISETLQTSLLVSQFPIREYVPSFGVKVKINSLYGDYYPELKLHSSYRGFGYYINQSDNVKNTPKALIFQGSYMNSYGAKFFQNAFHEYIFVHDYQNILDFPYYFNIFQPECVIFEVAEYTLNSTYFDYKKMQALDFNPAITSLSADAYIPVDYTAADIEIETGNTLTTVTWHTEQTFPYVWMSLEKVYDMQKVDGGYQATIETAQFEKCSDSIRILAAAK